MDTGRPRAKTLELRSESILLAMYYSLPEPPTLNAVLMLKQCFGRVVFLRNNMKFPPDFYLDTPELKEIGKCYTVDQVMSKNTLWKLARFARYALALRRELARGNYRLVVLHDYLALLAFHLVRKSAGYRGLVWFNSYDAIDLEHTPPGRLSLIGLVVAWHAKLFSELDFFSMPTAERKPYYPLDRVKRETFVIPNFPALTYYQRCQKQRHTLPDGPVKLVYMGALGPGHGYEQVMGALHTPVAGRTVELILKGWIREDYRQQIVALAKQYGMSDRVVLTGFVPYPKLPAQAADCTIGLAIYTGKDIMNRTPGTASNKIYEYIAVGLPVILLDTPYFRKFFGMRKWAFFTDLSESSLRNTIRDILSRYEEASAAAVQDYREEFTYESVFTPAFERVIEALAEPADA
jgi:glycosyltransferase involved in cell wall biosynthesis